MKFNKETVIITDPCYFMRAKHHGIQPVTEDDWKTSSYGEDLSKLGFDKYLSDTTGVGDWCCDVIDTNTGEKIGEFCADSGMVCVVPLNDVLSYNPMFDYHLKNKWTCTTIEDFEGDIILYKDENGITIVKGVGNINFENVHVGF